MVVVDAFICLLCCFINFGPVLCLVFYDEVLFSLTVVAGNYFIDHIHNLFTLCHLVRPEIFYQATSFFCSFFYVQLSVHFKIQNFQDNTVSFCWPLAHDTEFTILLHPSRKSIFLGRIPTQQTYFSRFLVDNQ